MVLLLSYKVIIYIIMTIKKKQSPKQQKNVTTKQQQPADEQGGIEVISGQLILPVEDGVPHFTPTRASVFAHQAL